METEKHSFYKDDKLEYDLDEQVIINDAPSTHHNVIEEPQFTWRATIVGSLLGCLIGNFSRTPSKKKRDLI